MLSHNTKELLLEVAEKTEILDLSSKSLFITLHKEYVKASSEHFNSLRKEVNQFLEESITSDVIRNAVKRVAQVAYKWADKRVLSKVDVLHYDNIRGTITLLNYIEKEKGSDVAKQVRNRLARVNGKTSIELNNKYSTKLKELKGEYKVAITDDDRVVEINPIRALDVVENNLSKYTIEQLEVLAKLINDELSTDDAKVA